MGNKLVVSVGQFSHHGKKDINQDFHDLNIPQNHLLTTKGIAVAIADGISSSKVSQEASKMSVVSFLQEYYATPESWGVEKSATNIIHSINSWLYSQNRDNLYHLDKDKGYVCTFSSMIMKSNTAHIFHVGDVRIYLVREQEFSQLTTDHRAWVSDDKSYLARALGIDSKLNIDYETLALQQNDILIFATDGVYEYVSHQFINETIKKYPNDLDTVAKIVVDKAYENDSGDNLTIQLVKVDKLPDKNIKEIQREIDLRPLPPILEENQEFDGYKILRELSHSSRSHVYLALDLSTEQKVVLKIPSLELRDDESYLESFLLEEWIAKRINSPYVLKAYEANREKKYFYLVNEFIDGQTLQQWMIDNPKPSLDEVREITEQIIKALNVFHRLEMVYQDLRPHNIMIDKRGTVKIIDFGAVDIKGINEIDTYVQQPHIKGSATYCAPEYFLGEMGTKLSDQFSLGVLVYEMLSHKLPYGTTIARTQTKFDQKALHYKTLYPIYPVWIDECVKKALSMEPHKRYSELSEFLYDLKKPNPKYLVEIKEPVFQSHPVVFWKTVSIIFSMIIFYLVFYISKM
jgi:serine/threonine protein kinase